MFQDIRTPKRSLRDILPSRAEEEASAGEPPRRRRGGGKWLIWLIILIVLVGIGWFISLSLASATVTVTPKVFDLAFNHEAVLVPYELVKLSPISDSRAVKTIAGGTSEQKATGQITIYNNTNQSQSLIAKTRFEADNGKIYRISAPVAIPAAKSATDPGTLAVSVTADGPGPDYNLSSTDTKFTVPGFKGDPKFDKISAKLKTPIVGGSTKGTRQLASADKAALVKELKQSLQSKILLALQAQLPEGFVAYDGTINAVYTEALNPIDGQPAENGQFVLTATPEALIFDTRELTKSLLTGRAPEGLDPSSLVIKKLDSLVLTPDYATQNPSKKQIAVAVDGAVQAQVILDEARLKTELSGTAKQAAGAIFAEYPAIGKAQLKLSPPWLQTVPADLGKISVEMVEDK